MYSPVKLTVKNFISHTDSTFVFKKDALTLIFGKNEDDKEEGANSNGSGKSAIIEAITYALTGESYREVNKDDIIQDGEKEAYIYFELYNDFLKEKLVIERWIKKSSSICKVFINDKEKKELTSVPEANKFILIDKIGFNSKEDLLNFFIINQDNSSSFFTNNDTKQKEIISRFIDTTAVNLALKKIENERLSVVAEKSILVSKSLKFESSIDEYSSLIDDEENIIEITTDELIQPFKNEILENEQSIKDKTVSIQKINKEIKNTTSEMEVLQLEIENFSSYQELEKQIKLEIKDCRNKQAEVEQEKKKLELKLKEAISCPKCNHEFILKHEHENLDDIKKLLLQKQKEYITVSEKDVELNKERIVVEQELKKMEVLISKYDKLNLIATDCGRRKRTHEKDVQDLITRNEKLNKKVDAVLNEEKTASKIPAYTEKRNNLQLQLDEVQKEITAKEKIIEEKDYQLFHLGKKGFLTYLANESIKTIEGYCNTFLNTMNTNLQVLINGYKILGNGEVRDKIEVFIVKNGIIKGKFDKYSGGQKERVKLASILTFFSLINNGLNGKGLDLLCLDESLDHLDELGQKKCLELLKTFKITTLVITHGHAETLLDGYNKVVIKYKNRESSIV